MWSGSWGLCVLQPAARRGLFSSLVPFWKVQNRSVQLLTPVKPTHHAFHALRAQESSPPGQRRRVWSFPHCSQCRSSCGSVQVLGSSVRHAFLYLNAPNPPANPTDDFGNSTTKMYILLSSSFLCLAPSKLISDHTIGLRSSVIRTGIPFPIVMKNWCFWVVVLEKTLESPLDSREIKPINDEFQWKDWCWSANTLATWCQELTHWKRPWCWKRLRAGGEAGDRGWDVRPTEA